MFPNPTPRTSKGPSFCQQLARGTSKPWKTCITGTEEGIGHFHEVPSVITVTYESVWASYCPYFVCIANLLYPLSSPCDSILSKVSLSFISLGSLENPFFFDVRRQYLRSWKAVSIAFQPPSSGKKRGTRCQGIRVWDGDEKNQCLKIAFTGLSSEGCRPVFFFCWVRQWLFAN